MILVWCLMLFNSLISGIGILLIIPLLVIAGINFPRIGDGSTGVSGWLPMQYLSHLETVLVVYCLLVFFAATCTYLQSILSVRLRTKLVSGFRYRIVDALLHAEWRYLARGSLANYTRLTNAQVNAVGIITQHLLILCRSITLFFVLTGLSLLVSPFLTLVAVAVAIALLVVLLPISRILKESGHLNLGASRRLFQLTIDQFTNVKLIKSHSAEQDFLTRAMESSGTMEAQQVRLARYTGLARLVNLSTVAVMFASLVYIGLEFAELAVENLLVLLVICARLFPQFQTSQTAFQNLVQMSPQYNDLEFHLTELRAHRDSGSVELQPLDFSENIRLSNVAYQYPDTSAPVFVDVNATIYRNQSTAILGPSGSGKTTLADMIAGLISPTRGEILIDDQLLNRANRGRWRLNVAYVTQDDFFLHDTIRANMSLNRSNPPSDEEIMQVLKIVGTDDFVRDAHQLDRIVGDRGMQLSGGQRQRLALARGLLTKPDVLILDEATNALDEESESIIANVIDSLEGCLTLILIAHDPKFIVRAKNRIDIAEFNP